MRILLQLATVVRLHERDRELADQPRLPSSEQTLPRALVIEGAETLVGRHHRIHDWSSEQKLNKNETKIYYFRLRTVEHYFFALPCFRLLNLLKSS